MYEIFANLFGSLCVLFIILAMATPFAIMAFFILAYLGFNKDINRK